ncbi:MAG: cytochrome c-type biogenesis protein CcmH [Rhodothalassiaceae bacterium]
MTRLILLLVLMIGSPAWGVGVDRNPLDDPAKEAEARALMQEIRCVVCEGQSIADSNAGLAEEMRALIRERIGDGEDRGEIKAYLVARYGDEILLRPRVTARTWVLWALPLILLAAALPLLAKLRRPPAPPPLSPEDEARAEALLDEVSSRS